MQFPPAKSTSIWMSLLVLLAGGIALGIAAIPPLVFNQPLGAARVNNPPPPPAERQGGVNFKLGKLEINVGGKIEAPPPAVRPPNPVKWFLVSAMAIALPTIVIGAFAWQRESRPVLAGTGIALAVLAVAWQYVIIGIVIGVAVALVIVLLGALS